MLVMSGVIGPGAFHRFQADVNRIRPDFIVLDGPGGGVFEAILIGTEIRRRGLATLVRGNRSCASACAIVFLSGRTRYLGNGASVGLHSAANDGGRADANGTNFMARYLSGVGVPRSIVRQMAAIPPSDIRWLTKTEQRSLGIRPYE
jgi:hypothetical protein